MSLSQYCVVSSVVYKGFEILLCLGCDQKFDGGNRRDGRKVGCWYFVTQNAGLGNAAHLQEGPALHCRIQCRYFKDSGKFFFGPKLSFLFFSFLSMPIYVSMALTLCNSLFTFRSPLPQVYLVRFAPPPLSEKAHTSEVLFSQCLPSTIEAIL